jgi:pyridoxal phosphate enzyme (YggS family)
MTEYLAVSERVRAAAVAAGRDPASVKLVAVTKTFGAETILPVIEAGHRCFGENRVQEAMRKWPPLKERFPDIELHLIGPLQTNKARDAVGFFDVIHSLDRPSLAAEIAKEIARTGGLRPPRLLVQVNTGHEPQKAGVMPEETDAFLDQCRARYGLPVEGLMCIPPVDEDPAPHFAMLAEMARRHGLPELSMGMSGDFEAAIAAGATYVRIGSAIFGAR